MIGLFDQGFTILGDNIRYTGYKTNGVDTYDSFALSNLQDALVKSFFDPDLQQYATFTTAVEQLIGAVDWVLDPANNQIVYTPNADPSQPNPNIPKIWLFQDKFINPNQVGFSNVAAACNFLIGKKLWSTSKIVTSVDATESGCMAYNNGSLFGSVSVVQVANPAYDPDKEDEKKTLPLETVAQKVISNAEGGDEVLNLLSEDYINLVANSIFDSNPAKQFVKLSDLNSQLEANKVLR